MTDGPAVSRTPPVTRLEWGLLATLTLMAGALRLWQLDILPPGIHVDEAYNILDAQAVIAGWRPIFLPANAGRDVLYTYLQAPLLALFGSQAAASIGPARMASALIGTLSIPIFWATARALAVAIMNTAITDADRASAGPAARTSPVASNQTTAAKPSAGQPGTASEIAHNPTADAAIRRIALFTAALTAFSYWHLHFSRFGIRAILFPPLVCLLILAWWRLLDGFDSQLYRVASVLPAAPAEPAAAALPTVSLLPALIPLGLLLGLAFYAHPAGRALVALPAAHAAWLWWRDRDPRPARALGAAFALALLLAAPLLFFWWQHPETFTSHAGETSILGQGPVALVVNALKVVGMFLWAGDPAPWRNLPARTVFGPIFSPSGGGWTVGAALASIGTFFLVAFFVAGLVRLAESLRAGQRWAGLLACWLLVLLLPTAVTDAAPNFSRAIGILPLPFLLVALGLESGLPRLAESIRTRSKQGPNDHEARSSTSSPFRDRLALALVTIALLTTGYDYFGRFASNDRSPLAFDDDKVALGNRVREERAAGMAVYLSPDMAAHPTLQLVAGEPPAGFDLQEGLVFPYTGIAEVVYPRLPGVDDHQGHADGKVLGRLAQLLDLRNDSPSQARGLLEHDGPIYPIEALRIRPDGFELPSTSVADFDDYIRLRDWQIWPASATMSPGHHFELTTYWEALRPIEHELNLTLQLVTAAGEGITQVDGPPLGGSYPTDRWQPGELVIDLHRLTIPEDAPTGPAILRLGWYDWRDGSVLTDAEGKSVVEILRFEIRP